MLTENTTLSIIIFSGVIMLVAVLTAIYRRQRRSGDRVDDGDDPTIAAFRNSHESFYRILQIFQQRHDLAEILSERDVRDAYKLLRLKNNRPETRADSPLQLQDPSREISEERLQAAMLTILRAIYMDERLVADLDPSAHEELDRLLEGI